MRVQKELDHFDLPYGPSNHSVSKCGKHLIERLRNRTIGAGFCSGPHKINKGLLQRIIVDRHLPALAGLFAPDDEANVAMANRPHQPIPVDW
jgi:hypothetical protein